MPLDRAIRSQGHLFDLAEDENAMLPTAREPKPFAAELKQYVGLAA